MNCAGCRYAGDRCENRVSQWFTCDCSRVTGDCKDGKPKKAKLPGSGPGKGAER